MLAENPSSVARRGAAKTTERLARIDRVIWVHVIGVGGAHVAALAAPFAFSWRAVLVFAALWFLVGCLGVCVGYHRLLTHRAFRAPPWLRYALAVLGTLAWQGTPSTWVGRHRLHHRLSDRGGDPHSPRHGFFWAHMGWVFFRGERDAEAIAPDIDRDPGMRWIDRLYLAPQATVAGLLYAAGEWLFSEGLAWLVWGVPARITLVYHLTWLVNSAGHRFGYRSYATYDGSRNAWWVALLTWGEGWHNNHHASPRAASHGRLWYEIDVGYLVIRALAAVGLARDVVAASLVRPKRPEGAPVSPDFPEAKSIPEEDLA